MNTHPFFLVLLLSLGSDGTFARLVMASIPSAALRTLPGLLMHTYRLSRSGPPGTRSWHPSAFIINSLSSSSPFTSALQLFYLATHIFHTHSHLANNSTTTPTLVRVRPPHHSPMPGDLYPLLRASSRLLSLMCQGSLSSGCWEQWLVEHHHNCWAFMHCFQHIFWLHFVGTNCYIWCHLQLKNIILRSFYISTTSSSTQFLWIFA